MHLDEMHSDGTQRTAARQDDLDDVADAILGFFRGAGKAVKSVGAPNEARAPGPSHGPAAAQGPGAVRSLTAGFGSVRRAAVSAMRLEDNRVERRMERLALAHKTASSSSDLVAAEQRAVPWEADDARDACPLCARRFGRLAVRRHHCRLCGRLVCGSCTDGTPRTCGDCARTVARIRTRHTPRPIAPVVPLYEEIRGGMADADALLPAFNKMLAHHRHQADLARAAALRRKLTAAFGSVDRASKLIAALPAATPTDARLHAAVRRAVVLYLQTHMFTLSMVPPSNSRQSGSLPATPAPVSRSSSIDQPLQQQIVAESPPPAPVTAPSSAPTATNGGLAASLLSYVVAPRAKPKEAQPPDVVEVDAERRAQLAETPLEEKLATLQVLRDQRQRVLGYISEAQRERRLEDAGSLQTSLQDLDAELSIIERNL
ncbi:carboxypeptidase Y-deficient [Coemansia furcata]|uniref:Carboxypeptidase Y-deficient n=1 Tax=Coemansia furcata TaxID=417177 RepID=A0ACC1LN94_9FUNG|nr:carboxypeptidase Y-deficient [Coemansia furcata]